MLNEWFDVLAATGLARHTELMNYLKTQHSVSHGFDNGIALQYRARGSSQEGDDLVDSQFSGAKVALRPVYERLVAAASAFGADVEIVPKKNSVSLRRSKQFALVEAPSAKRIQLGLQLKGEPATERLLPGNEMCSHRVNLAGAEEVDDEVLGWLHEAYDRN